MPNSTTTGDKNSCIESTSVRFAESLHWNESRDTSIIRQSVRGIKADIAHTYLGTEIATVILSNPHVSPKSMLGEAALYTYHTSAEWGIATDLNEFVLFNSHWIRHGYWYALPAQSARHLFDDSVIDEKGARLLESLTPDGIRRNKILDITREFAEPEHLLKPVDDALVDNLDNWRRESLRHARSTEAFDEELQKLFAQLFVLRAVEDRGLSESMQPLESCFAGGQFDVATLKAIFESARHLIGSEIFETGILDIIPDFVLSGIIRDLYNPSDLVRYNFEWIDTEVLGRAYQKYLSTLLVPQSMESQMRLFEQPLREARLVPVQKKSGIYYTPSYLVRYLVGRSLDEQKSFVMPPNSNDLSGENLPRIADISCGSGSFLTASLDSLISVLREHDPKRNWGKELIENRCILGIDTDPRAVTLAQLSLWLRLASEPDPLPLPSLQNCVICGDSLKSSTWEGIDDAFDLIVGNPPFIATKDVEDRESLSQKFIVAKGRFDYSYLFIEMAIRQLKPGGALGMVVPNRVFRNRDAGLLREHITGNMRLRSIADFTSAPVFAKVGAYIGTIVARKRDAASQEEESLRYMKLTALPTRFISSDLMWADLTDGYVATEDLVAFNAPEPNGTSPWIFLSDLATSIQIAIENQAQSLASIALVRQGIKTGANDVFLLDVIEDGGILTRCVNGFSQEARIESAILRPAVSGSNLARYQLIERETKTLIYPYLNNVALPESQFAEHYPYAYQYLFGYKSMLSERSRVSPEGKAWYELSEKRDEDWLNSPKLLIRDLAQQVSFAVDYQGGFYCIGGTAVIPADPSITLPLLAYLNSGFINWQLSHRASTYQGNFFKFEPQHISELPVLTEVVEEGAFRDGLTEMCLAILENPEAGATIQSKIDEMLCGLVGIRPSEMK